jgi:hypothetical protein
MYIKINTIETIKWAAMFVSISFPGEETAWGEVLIIESLVFTFLI